MSLCNREASVVRRPSVRPSVCLSVCKLLHASRYFYHKHDSIATKLAHDGPHMGLHPGYAQGQGQGQRSRDTGTSVMSRTVCYTVPYDVLSLHALTLRSTVTLSFQYKCQAARCDVYIMEWATPSLTVLLLYLSHSAMRGCDWSKSRHVAFNYTWLRNGTAPSNMFNFPALSNIASCDLALNSTATPSHYHSVDKSKSQFLASYVYFSSKY